MANEEQEQGNAKLKVEKMYLCECTYMLLYGVI